MRIVTAAAALAAVISFCYQADAVVLGFPSCTATGGCVIESNPPNPVTQDPNDNALRVWEERQNVTLTEDLRVDRIADPGNPVVGGSAGNWVIKSGSIVSSHYIQYDGPRMQAQIEFDSVIFAIITADQKLFDSDFLGLPGLDYNDFINRGLETNDTTTFSDRFVDVNFTTTSPGDWMRLITAFSPTAEARETPAPAALGLFALGLAALRRR